MLLVDDGATGFMSLLENSSALQVSLLDEPEDCTRIFTRDGSMWLSDGEYLQENQLADFLKQLASDCVAYKIEVSQRDETIQSLLPMYT